MSHPNWQVELGGVTQTPLSSHTSAGVSVSPTHDWAAPQCVPTALFAPSTHVFTPPVHEMTPNLHAPGLVLHVLPAAQAMQFPALLQTMSVPQLLPAVLLPASTQVVAPVKQDVVPSLHG